MIYIVSGLMRSGTSLMMHLLKESGFEIVYSQEREKGLKKSPIENPYYYEDQNIMKGIIEDPGDLEGKLVKVLGKFLHKLPSWNYRVIYMTRPDEQRRRSITRKCHMPPVFLEKMLNLDNSEDLLRYATERFNPLIVPFDDLVRFPDRQLARVEEFLEMELDFDHLRTQIRPDLKHF